MRVHVLVAAITALSSCKGTQSTPSAQKEGPLSKSTEDIIGSQIRDSEQQAATRAAARVCNQAVQVYDGSIAVSSNAYVHSVARGDDYVDVPIEGLDSVYTQSTRVQFTLDYPFEQPLTGAITGEITLRRTIDAIRAAYRQMYAGTTQRDLPGMDNKDVTGAHGRAFHVIDDLFIERIDLCAGDTLDIMIGS